MAGIFISYRREDSAGWTGRLSERLKQKFGTASIFMDIDTIQPGTDFAKALRSAVGSCDVLLAMIGPNWPIATSPEGQRRLEDPNDWVRTELTAALNRSIPVIPVLVGGADLPKVDTLPDELKKLFQYQTHELTDKRWEYDSSQLELVLEKVLGGGKPKRNVKQTLLAHRGALVALGIVVIGLAVALISPVARWSTQGTGIAQTNGSGIVTERNTPSLPSPEPVAQLNPTEPASQISAATTGESPPAQPIPIADKPESEKIAASVRIEDGKVRSLPAGAEVKFMAGDLVFRLTSIRLEDQFNGNWLLSTSILTRNSGSDVNIYYESHFRLQIDDSRHAPTKTSSVAERIASDSEQSGEVSFVVPKTARRVGFRITYDNEQTTIPIDLKYGVSRSDVRSSSIPRSLARPARIIGVDKGSANYDFRALSLEPYNLESFLLRISLRVTTDKSGFTYYGQNYFRLVFDDLPHEPARGANKSIPAHTYADTEIVFIVPKSVTQALLRVKDGDTWRSTSINLKANHS